MTHTSRIGRVGGLAVALGIGGALAASPWIASADPLDFQISIDGYDLIPAADTTASATSGMGDFAIAYGAGSSATADGGFFNSAFASGAGSSATAGSDSTDTFDTAVATGAGSTATADEGMDDYAGASGGGFTDVDLGNYDAGTADGANSLSLVNGVSSSGAFASGAGSDAQALTGFTPNATDSLAIADGTNAGASTDGSQDFAADFGNNDPFGGSASAGFGMDNIATVFGSDSTALADSGDSNLAIAFGNDLTAITSLFEPTAIEPASLASILDPILAYLMTL